MLKRYDLSELRYTTDPEIVIEGSRDYVRYDDIKSLIELSEKIINQKHPYTVTDFEEFEKVVKEILS